MTPAATARAVLGTARDRDLPLLAAAIAYYAFVSVLPAVLFAVVLATALGGEALAGSVLAGAEAYLAPAGQDLLADAVANTRCRAGATVLGLVVLAWGTLRTLRGLDVAFSRIYGTEPDALPAQVVDAAVVFAAMGVAVAGMVVGGALLAVLPAGGDLAGFLLLLVGLVVVFLPVYYVFPDADVTAREVLPGAALAGVGCVGLQAAFQAYVAAAVQYRAYGVIGGALLLVTWFYAAAALVLLGAVLNAVRGNRQVQHAGRREA
ncbi:MAG: YihY/virulence factor BrkB family protein [Halobacteriales archaeon]